MNHLLADLIKVLRLERLEINLFRGESRDIGSPQVYGGQVLGQALMAAAATVEGRAVHSLHAYFLRRGDIRHPIVYDVDRSRDGSSFSSRRVIAIQHGQQIFHMSASFQAEESGLDHEAPMPAVPEPESLADSSSAELAEIEPHSGHTRDHTPLHRPFQFRRVPSTAIRNQSCGAPLKCFWFRAIDRVPADDTLHRCLLAYVSDYQLVGAALSRHGVSPLKDEMIVASLDHAMWFHRPVRVDDWLLYATDSPSASGARGFARGSLYSRSGHLLASTAQEGLMRVTIGGGHG